MIDIGGISNKSKAYFYLIITMSAWGSLYVVSKFVMDSVPPLTVLLSRYLVAVIPLLLLLKKQKPQKIEKKDYKYIAFIGVFGYSFSIAAQFLGTNLLNAGLASLLNSTSPIFMIIFAMLVLKEKVTITKIISIITAIIGVYIILGGGDLGGSFWGILFSIVSVLSWSLMSVIVRKVTLKYEPLTVTTYAVLIALVCTIPLSAYELSTTTTEVVLKPSVILGLVYIGLVCTAFTNILWNKSLSMIDAGSCALFYPLQPMISVLFGCLFLGESINSCFVVGAVFILGGILFSVIADRKKT